MATLNLRAPFELRLIALRRILPGTAMPGSVSADLSHGDDIRRLDLSKPQTSFAAHSDLRDLDLRHLARKGVNTDPKGRQKGGSS